MILDDEIEDFAARKEPDNDFDLEPVDDVGWDKETRDNG